MLAYVGRSQNLQDLKDLKDLTDLEDLKNLKDLKTIFLLDGQAKSWTNSSLKNLNVFSGLRSGVSEPRALLSSTISYH